VLLFQPILHLGAQPRVIGQLGYLGPFRAGVGSSLGQVRGVALCMPSLIAQLIESFCDPNEVSNHRNGIGIRDAPRAGR